MLRNRAAVATFLLESFIFWNEQIILIIGFRFDLSNESAPTGAHHLGCCKIPASLANIEIFYAN